MRSRKKRVEITFNFSLLFLKPGGFLVCGIIVFTFNFSLLFPSSGPWDQGTNRPEDQRLSIFLYCFFVHHYVVAFFNCFLSIFLYCFVLLLDEIHTFFDSTFNFSLLFHFVNIRLGVNKN